MLSDKQQLQKVDIKSQPGQLNQQVHETAPDSGKIIEGRRDLGVIASSSASNFTRMRRDLGLSNPVSSGSRRQEQGLNSGEVEAKGMRDPFLNPSSNHGELPQVIRMPPAKYGATQ